jgi:hypothetical protein
MLYETTLKITERQFGCFKSPETKICTALEAVYRGEGECSWFLGTSMKDICETPGVLKPFGV